MDDGGIVMCERCERADFGEMTVLHSRENGRRVRLCQFCVAELAMYATRDEAALPFLEAMARRGLGGIWRGAEQIYLLRDPGASRPLQGTLGL